MRLEPAAVHEPAEAVVCPAPSTEQLIAVLPRLPGRRMDCAGAEDVAMSSGASHRSIFVSDGRSQHTRGTQIGVCGIVLTPTSWSYVTPLSDSVVEERCMYSKRRATGMRVSSTQCACVYPALYYSGLWSACHLSMPARQRAVMPIRTSFAFSL